MYLLYWIPQSGQSVPTQPPSLHPVHSPETGQVVEGVQAGSLLKASKQGSLGFHLFSNSPSVLNNQNKRMDLFYSQVLASLQKQVLG